MVMEAKCCETALLRVGQKTFHVLQCTGDFGLTVTF